MPKIEPKKAAKDQAPSKGGKFKLLAGQHQGPDLREDPVINYNPKGEEVSRRYPTRTYNTGQIVESDKDLVAKFGAQKFQLVGAPLEAATPGDPTPENMASGVAIAPHGQVSTGFQQAMESPEGTTRSGALEAPEDPKETAGLAPEGEGAAPNDFESWNLKDLKDYAAENEIDLKGATHKDEVLRAVKRSKR